MYIDVSEISIKSCGLYGKHQGADDLAEIFEFILRETGSQSLAQ
jgi:hypothetical protein